MLDYLLTIFMNKNERRFLGEAIYWTIVPILFVVAISACFSLMNIANTLCFIVGLVGVSTTILYFWILIKRKVFSCGENPKREENNKN